MRKLLDGPVRTRVFWATLFAAAAMVVAEIGFDLGQYETAFDLILTLLVSVGALTGTTGTTPIDELDRKGW